LSQLIRDEEWNFDRVPLERVAEALVYEFCRREDWIRDAIKDHVAGAAKDEPQSKPGDAVYVREDTINVTEVRRQWSVEDRNPRKEIPVRGGKKARKRRQKVLLISARRAPRPGRVNPFVYYDLEIVLSKNFPCPYLDDPKAVATLEIREGMSLPAVHDLRTSSQWASVPNTPMHKLTQRSPLLQGGRWLVSKKNGELITHYRGDVFREFAVAIDFTRTNDDLCRAFRLFLKRARLDYALPEARPNDRLSRGRPLWLTENDSCEGLQALTAERLIQAFGSSIKASQYRKEIRSATKCKMELWSTDQVTPKDLRRAAKRCSKVAARLFRSKKKRKRGF
jgi:hypothetical protein